MRSSYIMAEDDQIYPPISPLRAGLLGCCPRCGKAPLFNGFLTLAPACDVCGLDFSFADAADGPAFFVMSIAGFIVVGGALAVEILYKPPLWVHVALWLPLGLAVPLLLLRPAKGLLVALQYHYRAEEGRRMSDNP
jgi:uncharacterized protein (DUF983 family)